MPHHLRDTYAERGEEVAVYGDFIVRLNGRNRERFINDTTDLARVEWTWGEKDWVLPER